MTRRLILMRHAKSSWDDPLQRDHDRPLNDRGQRAALALGKWLAANAYLPDQVLCSTATRTRQTLQGLNLPQTPVTFLDTLYHASPDMLLKTLRQTASGACVLILAHNPGCAEFSTQILTRAQPQSRLHHHYPTGATLVVDLPIKDWKTASFHSATSVNFITPRDITD